MYTICMYNYVHVSACIMVWYYVYYMVLCVYCKYVLIIYFDFINFLNSIKYCFFEICYLYLIYEYGYNLYNKKI